MQIDNELRRTKAKLALLEDRDSPFIQVIWDLMDQIDPESTEQYKLLHLSLLQGGYKKYIRENTPENPSQTKLFKV